MKISPQVRNALRLTLPFSLFLLLSQSTEMLLSIAAALFDIGASSPTIYAVYFLREILLLAIPAVTLVFLLAAMRRTHAPFLLASVLFLYAFLALILNVIKTMFFCHFLNDVIWDADVCVPYLLEECTFPAISLALVLIGALVLFYLFSKKMAAKRPLRVSPFSSRASLSYAIAALIFFLRACLIEITESLIPFMERINLGYATASVGDLVYIVFKFVFYFVCALIVYLLAHKFDRYVETKAKSVF